LYSSLLSPLPVARWFVQQIVQDGDHVVDCTAGNGHDTVFLAGLVGEAGTVYAFDVQRSAIEETQKRVLKHGYANRVQCILDTHLHVGMYVPKQIRAAMFNLGYMPGGDHQITTLAEETSNALQKVLNLLLPGGITTMVVYPGHPEGKREEEVLNSFVQTLDKKKFAVMVGTFLKASADSPKLIAIQKGICEMNETGVHK
jgi:predicted methyltransferase